MKLFTSLPRTSGKALGNESLFLPANYGADTQVSERSRDEEVANRRSGIYAFAAYLKRGSNLKYIIDIGCGYSEERTDLFYAEDYLGIGDGPRMLGVLDKLPNAKLICSALDHDFELDEQVLKQAVVVCDNTLGRLSNPAPLLKTLARIEKIAPFVLISAVDRDRLHGMNYMGPPTEPGIIREWSTVEFKKLLQASGIECSLMGNTIHYDCHTDKVAIITVAGAHASFTKDVPQKKVLAILSCYNDADIIFDCVENLLQEGAHIWFLDNWSEDATWTIINEFQKNFPEKIHRVERFPANGPDKEYKWQAMLARKEEIALENGAKFDWFIHHDSDEIRSSPWPGVTMVEAISFVHHLGYNAIDHLFADFRPTRDGFNATSKAKKFFTHFEFNTLPSAFVQKRAWAHQEERVNLIATGGHDATFSNRRVFPLRFLIQHFSLRSSRQAFTKIFKHRLPRFPKEERALGWHVHYDHYNENNAGNFLWKTDELISYSPAWFNSEFILERLAALNVKSPVVERKYELGTDCPPPRKN